MFQQCNCDESLNLRAGLNGMDDSITPPAIYDEENCRGWIQNGKIISGGPRECLPYAIADRDFSPLPPQPENGITRPTPVFAPMPAPAAPAAPALLIPSQSDLDRAREMNRIRDEEAERIRLQNLAIEQSRFSQGFRPTFREGEWGQVRTSAAPVAAPAPAPVATPAPAPKGGGSTGGGMGNEVIARALPYFPEGEPLPNWPGDTAPVMTPEAPKAAGIGGVLALAALAVSLLR